MLFIFFDYKQRFHAQITEVTGFVTGKTQSTIMAKVGFIGKLLGLLGCGGGGICVYNQWFRNQPKQYIQTVKTEGVLDSHETYKCPKRNYSSDHSPLINPSNLNHAITDNKIRSLHVPESPFWKKSSMNHLNSIAPTMTGKQKKEELKKSDPRLNQRWEIDQFECKHPEDVIKNLDCLNADNNRCDVEELESCIKRKCDRNVDWNVIISNDTNQTIE